MAGVELSMAKMASEARLSRESASAARQQEAQFCGQVWISQWSTRSGVRLEERGQALLCRESFLTG